MVTQTPRDDVEDEENPGPDQAFPMPRNAARLLDTKNHSPSSHQA